MNTFKPPPASLVQLLLLGFLLLCSMFFSASETAFLSVNKLRVRYLKKRKNKKAVRVDNIIKNKQNFLTTSLIGNTLVNNLVTVVITTIAVSLFSGEKAVSIAVTVATILVLIFGEVVPKAVALVHPDVIALNVSIITQNLVKIFSPIVWLFNLFTKPFLFFFGVREEEKNTDVTEEDLKTFFEESEKLGQLSKYERNMMEKILSYADIQAKNIMTPRPDIVAISLEADIEEILSLSEKSHFSRFPVYDKDIDDIKGVFYIKDFLVSSMSYKDKYLERFDLNDFLREPIYVFEGASSDTLQELFHSHGQNMLIVLDEYGGTAGIVTMEDLTEEVFGDIEDEYDVRIQRKDFEKTADGFIVLGSMQISDFNKRFKTDFTDNNHETIAGIVLENFGTMPEVASKVTIGNYSFEVLETAKKKIKSLKVKKVEK